jgi:hypothetical protein
MPQAGVGPNPARLGAAAGEADEPQLRANVSG